MRPIVTLGFSHCFIGPIKRPMLLSCWRNAIRPRSTVNIHILGPQRNMRRRCFTISAGETRFICIGPENKSGHSRMQTEEEWGSVISEPRRWRNIKPLKREVEEESVLSGPIRHFCSSYTDVVMVATHFSPYYSVLDCAPFLSSFY